MDLSELLHLSRQDKNLGYVSGSLPLGVLGVLGTTSGCCEGISVGNECATSGGCCDVGKLLGIAFPTSETLKYPM